MKTSNIILILSVLSIFGIARCDGCNCVVMRMDDIQDYWLTQTQIDVMNVFKNSNTPLTSVIIGKDFGDDSVIVNAIKSNLAYASSNGWNFEVGNHGWKHDDFTQLSLATQNSWLQQARTKTVGLLNGYLTNDQFKSFVPPYNSFNSDTISAAKSNGFTIFSAGADEYTDAGRSYPGTDPNFREWPMQASTTDLSDTYKVTAAESLQMIQAQIQKSGFSVLMMHFVEFSNSNGDTDPNALNDLKNLIQMIKNAGITITNLRGLAPLYFGTPPPAPTPSAPYTTAAAPVVSTTRSSTSSTTRSSTSTFGSQAPLTTGKTNPSTGSSTSTGSSSSCTSGYMKCLTTNTYSTCTWSQWGPSQSCSSGTVCSVSGNYIYCIKP